MTSKAKGQRRHAKQRALERLGIEITNQELATMVQQIQSGKARLLGRASLRVTLWAFEIDGRPVKAVYDSDRHTIVTFIPMKAA